MAKQRILMWFPIDFSRGSERALDFAMKLARERRGKVIALHVVPADMVYAPRSGQASIFTDLWSAMRGKIIASYYAANDCNPKTARWYWRAVPISPQLSLARRTSCVLP